MMQSIYTAQNSMRAYQTKIDTISHNISNINNKNYSKQKVKFTTAPSIEHQNYSIGTGVSVQSIDRNHDEVLFKQLTKYISDSSEKKESSNKLNQLNKSLNSYNTENISNLVNKYFDSVSKYAETGEEEIKIEITENFEAIKTRKGYLKNLFNDEINKSLSEINEIRDETQSQIKELEKLIKHFPKTNNIKDKIDEIEKDISKNQKFQSYNKYEFNYQYEIKETSGRIKGLIDTVQLFETIKNSFNEKITTIIEEGELFINDDFKNPNKIIETENKELRINDINQEFINISLKAENSRTIEKISSAFFLSIDTQNKQLKEVNLDQELIDLNMSLKVYQAQSVIIKTADEMLKTIINLKS